MANREHLDILRHGIDAWNTVRRAKCDVKFDLTQAELQGVDLTKADFHEAYLMGANLTGANLREANLAGANLHEADLHQAYLLGANLRGANLFGANLFGANLKHTLLTGTNLRYANLTGCRVYGVSAWDIRLDEHTVQHNLVITEEDDLEVSVDDLEVAQFIYLLLTGPKLRSVFDVLLTKAVLILGRFSEERKPVLDVIRSRLRELDYLPILFDFQEPENQNVVDTVKTIGMLARFVVADLTDAKAVDQELQSILEGRKVPVQPLLQAGADRPTGMLRGLMQKYGDVLLPVYEYSDIEHLVTAMSTRVIEPAEHKVRELSQQTKKEIMFVRDDDGEV